MRKVKGQEPTMEAGKVKQAHPPLAIRGELAVRGTFSTDCQLGQTQLRDSEFVLPSGSREVSGRFPQQREERDTPWFSRYARLPSGVPAQPLLAHSTWAVPVPQACSHFCRCPGEHRAQTSQILEQKLLLVSQSECRGFMDHDANYLDFDLGICLCFHYFDFMRNTVSM